MKKIKIVLAAIACANFLSLGVAFAADHTDRSLVSLEWTKCDLW